MYVEGIAAGQVRILAIQFASLVVTCDLVQSTYVDAEMWLATDIIQSSSTVAVSHTLTKVSSPVSGSGSTFGHEINSRLSPLLQTCVHVLHTWKCQIRRRGTERRVSILRHRRLDFEFDLQADQNNLMFDSRTAFEQRQAANAWRNGTDKCICVCMGVLGITTKALDP